MLVDDLITQLQKLPAGSRVVETSGWTQAPPTFPIPCRRITLGQGLVIRIALPDREVEIGLDGWPT